ncbi:hypothetical protein A2316_00470 [Candidatus Falkowbacteria bacterium RIFOXYB2_FULL_38_15]|uniref:Uncharacterized protein n=1 Tax=Candidatus Falkowbacteria bacterium RIFOXYA2_FULL_38_12 TaxID=1797993 RepID=A0A1F5S1Y2_9BACT|nr:MAG: hypothetical protein A2257_04425 [Candidatus Falkowbacteria bacterium RIFOXYA2_FULL_38_12]OGF32871.1 MAG: hypothetical protein A2316_00470 [Candidatus Falkowbacteria bacterium RIFOXYB2_FULL_38_15]OGF44007.1 MAG: hypothetical protein A2555_01200 [Candidatus Falkowbacteria bacterium RIFOXYD2_FULL_39_16]
MKLLVNGNFTDEELEEIKTIFTEEEIGIERYIIKDIDFREITRIIFKDFSVVDFLRDLTLAEILVGFSKKVFHWVIRKKPNTEVQIKFELSFGLNKPVVNLGFPKDYTDYDDFSQTIRIEITDEFATSLKKGEMISVFWDKKNRCLKIIRF